VAVAVAVARVDVDAVAVAVAATTLAAWLGIARRGAAVAMVNAAAATNSPETFGCIWVHLGAS
ncbi:hypothetical protein, partial [Burkholderia pseudomallei]